jgi:hypothetical protein
LRRSLGRGSGCRCDRRQRRSCAEESNDFSVHQFLHRAVMPHQIEASHSEDVGKLKTPLAIVNSACAVGATHTRTQVDGSKESTAIGSSEAFDAKELDSHHSAHRGRKATPARSYAPPIARLAMEYRRMKREQTSAPL